MCKWVCFHICYTSNIYHKCMPIGICSEKIPLEGSYTVAVRWCWTIECSGITGDVREAFWLGSSDSLNPQQSYW